MIEFDNANNYEFDDEYINKLNLIFNLFKAKHNIDEFKKIELSILNDSEIRKINKEYRAIDKTTDVLSFSFYEGVSIDLLGVIYICYSEIAKFSSNTFLFNLAFLFVHGLLHIIGFDHSDEMSNAEKEIISAFFDY